MRNSDYIELYKAVVKLESDMKGNESIESWKRSIGEIEMDLLGVSYSYKIVQPDLLIHNSIDNTLTFSFEGYDSIGETISVISVILDSIKRIIELDCSEDMAPSFMDYEYGDLFSLIVTLRNQIRNRLNSLLKTQILGVFITQDEKYVYTTYENPSLFYDVDTKMYVGRLVEVNGFYEAILTQDDKTLKFKSVM